LRDLGDVSHLPHRGAGYDVTYCRNFTDVDDKIIKRAAEQGCDPLELTKVSKP
jgi:cysteinyl-tRNA synthetase